MLKQHRNCIDVKHIFQSFHWPAVTQCLCSAYLLKNTTLHAKSIYTCAVWNVLDQWLVPEKLEKKALEKERSISSNTHLKKTGGTDL